MGIMKTEKLMEHLKSQTNINDYFKEFNSNLHPHQEIHYLEDLLVHKSMTKSDIVSRTQLSRSYIYKIFSGEKTPSRDKLLQITFSLQATLEETNQLLKLFEHSNLYPKIKRDSIIIFAIEKQKDIYELNELLIENKEKPVFSMI